MNSLRKIFFVVGVGRSGTSLVMSMLDAHPDISIPPETQLLSRYLAQNPNISYGELIKALSSDQKYTRLGMDTSRLLKPKERGEPQHDFLRLYTRIVNIWATEHHVSIIGDKTPKYVELLPVIQKMYPEAFIIHVIRDPRDVYLSRTQAKWSAGRPDWKQMLAYRVQYRVGCDWGRDLFGKRYIEVQYEDLLKHPKNSLTKICDLLGVPFDNVMLEFEKSSRKLVFEDEISWKKELLGPLLKSNSGKWRKDLDPKRIRKIELICSDPFSEGRYTPNETRRWNELFIYEYPMKIIEKIYRRIIFTRNQKTIQSLDNALHND